MPSGTRMNPAASLAWSRGFERMAGIPWLNLSSAMITAAAWRDARKGDIGGLQSSPEPSAAFRAEHRVSIILAIVRRWFSRVGLDHILNVQSKHRRHHILSGGSRCPMIRLPGNCCLLGYGGRPDQERCGGADNRRSHDDFKTGPYLLRREERVCGMFLSIRCPAMSSYVGPDRRGGGTLKGSSPKSETPWTPPKAANVQYGTVHSTAGRRQRGKGQRVSNG